MIPLFDLHCDTFSRIFKNKTDFNDYSLHLSNQSTKAFSPYIQIGAIWSDCLLNDEEAYFNYLNTLKYIKSLNVRFSTKIDDSLNKIYILSIEDGRILNNNIDRLTNFFNDGVRVFTLNWKDNCCIGGAWNTDFSLTDFGKTVVKTCNELGIIVDLSHSSLPVQYDTIRLTNKPVIFSHSNSFSVCPHRRNITDDIFKEIVNLKGIVGISMCVNHLSPAEIATTLDIMHHIDWYLHLGGENIISLGCDFDGIDTLPKGICSASDLQNLYTEVEKNFSSSIAYKLFYENAYRFFSNNLE